MSRYDSLVQRLLPEVEYHQNRYARELGEVLAAGSRWLDLGAGERLHRGWIGPGPAELRQRAAWVVGCDLETRHMRRNLSLAAACVANGAALPFADESFDLVTANMVVEHLPEPALVFKEVARVLHKGGMFVFLTPNRGHPAVWLASVLLGQSVRSWLAVAVERRDQEAFPTFYRANTRATLQRIADDVALEVRTLETFSSWPLIRGFSPLTVLECFYIRARARPGLAPFRSNLLGRLRRKGGKGP
jgi:SAM-dependent methyltransferase